MIQDSRFKIQEGQTVVEVLLAAAVVSVALTALVAVVTTALAHNRNSQERVIAVRQAQEGMEFIRTVRDANPTWNGFVQELNDVGDGSIAAICLNDPMPYFDIDPSMDVAGGCAGYSIGNSTYTRTAMVNYATFGVAGISVRVEWGSKTPPDSVVLEGVLNAKF
jgi:Tfp pilus assembly protein PilV